MSTLTLLTTHGPVDLCFRPAGFAGGYEALRAGQVVIGVSDVDVPVASLADVIRSKRSAGRPQGHRGVARSRSTPARAGRLTLSSRVPRVAVNAQLGPRHQQDSRSGPVPETVLAHCFRGERARLSTVCQQNLGGSRAERLLTVWLRTSRLSGPVRRRRTLRHASIRRGIRGVAGRAGERPLESGGQLDDVGRFEDPVALAADVALAQHAC